MVTVSIGNYRDVFRSKAFAYFWTGFTASGIGDAMTRVALTWYVWDLTRSPQALGLLSFLYMAPIVLGGILAGWMLDRFGRRRVMIFDNLLRAAVVAAIPILNFVGDLQLWHVYLTAALYGSLMMISLAGGPSLIPSLVSRRHLSTANALETIGFTVSRAIGPPVSGVLIATIGAPNVLAIDAVTYLFFAWSLTRIPADARVVPEADQIAPSYSIKDAVVLMLRNRVLLSTTLMYMSFNIGLGMLFVWLPVYADEGLGGGAQLFGILMGLMAVGSLVSALLAGSVVFPFTYGTLISAILVLSGASLGILLLADTVWITALGITLFGLFNAPLTIWAQTLRMQIIPEPMRGRTFALLRMFMQSANPIGGAAAGPLLPLLGVAAVIGLSAVFVALPGAVGFRVKELRKMRV